MAGFKLISEKGLEIWFKLYADVAPQTCKAFLEALPFSRTFFHARVSGQEIWVDNAPSLNIIQENASVFVAPGEVVLGPAHPQRAKTANCFGIYYGEGKGLDACNIFAKVIEEDKQKLADLGDSIWKEGAQVLTLLIA